MELASDWTAQLDDAVASLAWSPDSRTLAVASAAGPITLFDTTTGQNARTLAGHKMGTLRVTFSTTGVLASGGQDGVTRIWGANGDVPTRELDAGGRCVEHLAWSPDGTLLAIGAGRLARIWDKDGAVQFEFPAHESTVSGLQWRGDGRGFATACFGHARLFKLGETQPYEQLEWKASLICLAWSPNGRFVAAGTQDSAVQFWRIPFRETQPLAMSGYPAKVKNLAWDRNSRWLATDGGEVVTVWDVSGKGPAGRKPVQIAGHGAKVSALAYQRKGDWIASGDEDGQVMLSRPILPRDIRKLEPLADEITQVAWSPDEKALAYGARDGTVRMIRLP